MLATHGTLNYVNRTVSCDEKWNNSLEARNRGEHPRANTSGFHSCIMLYHRLLHAILKSFILGTFQTQSHVIRSSIGFMVTLQS